MRSAALVLCALSTALCGCGDDLFGPGVVSVGGVPFREVTAKKNITTTLGEQPLAFRVVTNVTPATLDAHLDLSIVRASRPLALELAPEVLASDNPDRWPVVDIGGFVNAFSSGDPSEAFLVSFGIIPGDDAGPSRSAST